MFRLTDNFFKRKVLYLLPAVLLGVLGLYMAAGVEEYQSEGIVRVDSETFLASLTDVRDSGFSFLGPAAVANNELRGLMQTDSFVVAIIEQSGVQDRMRRPEDGDGRFIGRVRRAISSQPGGDQFLSVRAVADSPDIAQDLANATIETYIRWQIDADSQQSRVAESFVEDLADFYDEEADQARLDLAVWLAANPGSNDINDRPIPEQLELRALQDEIGSAEERFSAAIAKGEEARLATAQAESDVRQGFVVIDEPRLPLTKRNGPIDLLKRGIAFGIIGTLMSGVVLLFTSASDTTLRFPTEVEDLLGAELLAVVPKVAQP